MYVASNTPACYNQQASLPFRIRSRRLHNNIAEVYTCKHAYSHATLHSTCLYVEKCDISFRSYGHNERAATPSACIHASDVHAYRALIQSEISVGLQDM